jgi:hypothetical protein
MPQFSMLDYKVGLICLRPGYRYMPQFSMLDYKVGLICLRPGYRMYATVLYVRL